MVRKALRILLVVGVTGFAFFCMWRASALGLPDSRLAILVWAAIGAVAAAVSGCLAGRRLWRLVQRRPAAPVLLALIGIANLAVFHLLWGPPMCEDWGNPSQTETMTQAFLAAAAVFLLALSSYLLGYLLIRPRMPIRRGWRVLLIFLLYGSIPVGILIGDARFKSRGFQSPASVYLMKKVPFEKAFEDVLKDFPRVGGNARKEWPFTLFRGAIPSVNYEIPAGEVVPASGSVAVVDEEPLRLISYGLLPAPRSTLSLDESSEEERPLFWDPSGRPLADNPIPDLKRSEYHQTAWFHDVVVVLERPPDWNFRLFAVRLQYPAWDDIAIAEFFYPKTDENRIIGQGIVRFPVCGPLEFSLEFFQERSREYAMPAIQGATLELPWNRVYLHALCPRRLKSTTTMNTWLDVFKFTPQAADPERPVTTACFEAAMERMANLDIHAVLKDGTRVAGRRGSGMVFPLRHCEFDCALEEIAEFRISSVTHPTRVNFELPGIPVFPDVNEGVQNIFDFRFPVLPFKNRKDVSEFIIKVFNYYGAAPDTDPPDRPHEYWSVRDVLNYYFPDRWYTRDGKVQLHAMPKVPILRKIMLAARG